LFEHPSYVQACAEHEGSHAMLLEGAASLVLLEDRRGLHTVYGYPQPFGDSSTSALAELASSLAGLGHPVRLGLSPLDAGAELTALSPGVAVRENTRPICVVDLDEHDPLESFSAKARNMVRRASGGETEIQIGRLEPWFGREYLKAMRLLGADPLYSFGDGYFKLIAEVDHVVVRVDDPHGMATANLFLFGGRAGTYHLSVRRSDPAPPPGVVNLAVLTALWEARSGGIETMILGGGRGHGRSDPLFRFKREMATRVVERRGLMVGQGTAATTSS
jgi:hypothetical protein